MNNNNFWEVVKYQQVKKKSISSKTKKMTLKQKVFNYNSHAVFLS